MRGLFITATDTGAGKTVATCMLARELLGQGYRTGCYKPVCTGAEHAEDGFRSWSDVDALSASLERRFPADRICPQTFVAPLAPPSAAALEDAVVDSHLLRQGVEWWSDRVDVLLVEGVGGLLCPLTTEETVADLVRDLAFPLLIVSPLILGTINHTLLTIEVAQRRGLNIAGVLFNDVHRQSESYLESVLSEVEVRTSVPLLGMMTYTSSGSTQSWQPLGERAPADWFHLTGTDRRS
ncbi:MAG: dethiobiotin synthase [Planctomycetaceae bacterium]|nr:dethiobiotin synthase [Planctomycetaceae bacterium]